MLTINNIRLKNKAFLCDIKSLLHIITSKLAVEGVQYIAEITDDSITFLEVKQNKLFLSTIDNHIPLSPEDKRYKESKPYLITEKLNEIQFLNTENIILNTLANMGLDCDIKLKNVVLVKDKDIINRFPKPTTFPVRS